MTRGISVDEVDPPDDAALRRWNDAFRAGTVVEQLHEFPRRAPGG